MQVTWTKDGRELSDGDHYSITYSHGVCSLEVVFSRPEDSGRYMCRAVNTLGEHETSCKVEVEGQLAVSSQQLWKGAFEEGGLEDKTCS